MPPTRHSCIYPSLASLSHISLPLCSESHRLLCENLLFTKLSPSLWTICCPVLTTPDQAPCPVLVTKHYHTVGAQWMGHWKKPLCKAGHVNRPFSPHHFPEPVHHLLEVDDLLHGHLLLFLDGVTHGFLHPLQQEVKGSRVLTQTIKRGCERDRKMAPHHIIYTSGGTLSTEHSRRSGTLKGRPDKGQLVRSPRVRRGRGLYFSPCGWVPPGSSHSTGGMRPSLRRGAPSGTGRGCRCGTRPTPGLPRGHPRRSQHPARGRHLSACWTPAPACWGRRCWHGRPAPSARPRTASQSLSAAPTGKHQAVSQTRKSNSCTHTSCLGPPCQAVGQERHWPHRAPWGWWYTGRI